MNICDCCSRRFTAPAEHRECDEIWGHMQSYMVLGCPYCGGGYEDDEEADGENEDEADMQQ